MEHSHGLQRPVLVVMEIDRTITAPPSAVEKVVAFVDERVGLEKYSSQDAQ